MKTEYIVPVEQPGKVIPFEVKKDYLDFQRTWLTDLSNLNMAIDCSNGMASLLIKDLLGNQPHYLFDELDGSFPNHEPKTLKRLKPWLKKKNAISG